MIWQLAFAEYGQLASTEKGQSTASWPPQRQDRFPDRDQLCWVPLVSSGMVMVVVVFVISLPLLYITSSRPCPPRSTRQARASAD
eukprot:374928-Pyramimonas_sp.AAC.1